MLIYNVCSLWYSKCHHCTSVCSRYSCDQNIIQLEDGLLRCWHSLLHRTVLIYFQNELTFVFHPHPFLYLLFVLLRWVHLQGRCLLKRRKGRMSLLHHGDWACGKPAVTEHWQKSAQLKRHRKRRTQPGWCARPLLLASHPHWTIRTRKRSSRM